MAWVPLIDNNIQRRVRGTTDQLQTLMGVLVHDYRHASNKHENGRYWYLTFITLIQDYDGFLLHESAIPPLIFGNKDPKKCFSPLALEREYAFEIQVLAVVV